LVVGLDAWMVLFGALRDVAVGDTVQFGLRAIPGVVEGGTEPVPPTRLGLNYYYLGARLALSAAGDQHLETPFGCAYIGRRVLPPSWEGQIVVGEFELVVDADAPVASRPMPLWRVKSILRETPNWRDRRIEENRPIGRGRRLLRFAQLIQSPGLRYQGSPVECTSAFNDDGGLAHYNLEVEPAGEATESTTLSAMPSQSVNNGNDVKHGSPPPA
jgi:hypothetical protein